MVRWTFDELIGQACKKLNYFGMDKKRVATTKMSPTFYLVVLRPCLYEILPDVVENKKKNGVVFDPLSVSEAEILFKDAQLYSHLLAECEPSPTLSSITSTRASDSERCASSSEEDDDDSDDESSDPSDDYSTDSHDYSSSSDDPSPPNPSKTSNKVKLANEAPIPQKPTNEAPIPPKGSLASTVDYYMTSQASSGIGKAPRPSNWAEIAHKKTSPPPKSLTFDDYSFERPLGDLAKSMLESKLISGKPVRPRPSPIPLSKATLAQLPPKAKPMTAKEAHAWRTKQYFLLGTPVKVPDFPKKKENYFNLPPKTASKSEKEEKHAFDSDGDLVMATEDSPDLPNNTSLRPPIPRSPPIRSTVLPNLNFHFPVPRPSMRVFEATSDDDEIAPVTDNKGKVVKRKGKRGKLKVVYSFGICRISFYYNELTHSFGMRYMVAGRDEHGNLLGRQVVDGEE